MVLSWNQSVKQPSWLPTQHPNQLSSPEQLTTERAWVEVHETALRHNVAEIKQLLSPNTQLMAVVKADAYGHGAVQVAKTVLAAGGDGLAVATLQEGMELREAGITAPILILGAINSPTAVAAMTQWQLEPTLCCPEQAQLFGETLRELGTSLGVHLKLDTGMSRLGIAWTNATQFLRQVQCYPELAIKSVYSHLATADEEDTTVLHQQQQRFESAIAQLQSVGFTPPCLHLANSAATLRGKQFHYDRVRVGLALYGLTPSPNLAPFASLQPVLQVKARITQIKEVPAGAGVSYGHQFITDKPSRIAVVGIGYADGVPRNLSNHLQVLLNGKRVPQVGAITMDQLMLDVTAYPDIQSGEVVTLIGSENQDAITADDWAWQLGTISWEILCSFKHRLPRIVVP